MPTSREHISAGRLRRLTHRVARERILGVTGRVNDDLTITVKDPDESGNIFVRIGGNNANVKSVLNKKTGAERAANLRVELDYNSQGVLEVVGISADQDAFSAELLSSYEAPTVAGDLKQDTTPNALIKNLRVRVSSGLTVYIEPGYFYVGATQYYWPGGTLDLTSKVPSGSGMKAPVIIGIDSATLTAVAYKGTEVAQSLPPAGSPYFYGADFVAARNAATGGDAWLFAIGLKYGQTSITDQADFVDLRAEVVGAGGNVSGPGSSTDNAIVRWDGTGGTTIQNSIPTIDDSGNLNLQAHELRNFVERISTASTGTATYNIDWSAATIVELTLTGNPTITFSNLAAGRSLTLAVIQDISGSHTVTWPGSVSWQNGSAPTLLTAGNAVDYFTFTVKSDGSTVIGFQGGSPGAVTSVSGSAPIVSSGGTTPTISHATSGVSAATYTLATITVNAYGHVTSASNGSASTTGELLMQDGVTSPPVPIELEDGTDWLYADA